MMQSYVLIQAVSLIGLMDPTLNLHLRISWKKIKSKHVSLIIYYAEDETPQSLPVSLLH